MSVSACACLRTCLLLFMLESLRTFMRACVCACVRACFLMFVSVCVSEGEHVCVSVPVCVRILRAS